MKIVLASTSKYRRSLLAKLGLEFETCAPLVDESSSGKESPRTLAARLAKAKAMQVAKSYSDALVIGSDQVAELNGMATGKPGNIDNAVRQLSAASGKTVTFFTGLHVINTDTQQAISCVETYTVKFKHLTSEQITGYLRAEQPYDCAGSFKCEGLGICLFESMHGRDPNTLIGLPLIALSEALTEFGLDPLLCQQRS